MLDALVALRSKAVVIMSFIPEEKGFFGRMVRAFRQSELSAGKRFVGAALQDASLAFSIIRFTVHRCESVCAPSAGLVGRKGICSSSGSQRSCNQVVEANSFRG